MIWKSTHEHVWGMLLKLLSPLRQKMSYYNPVRQTYAHTHTHTHNQDHNNLFDTHLLHVSHPNTGNQATSSFVQLVINTIRAHFRQCIARTERNVPLHSATESTRFSAASGNCPWSALSWTLPYCIRPSRIISVSHLSGVSLPPEVPLPGLFHPYVLSCPRLLICGNSLESMHFNHFCFKHCEYFAQPITGILYFAVPSSYKTSHFHEITD